VKSKPITLSQRRYFWYVKYARELEKAGYRLKLITPIGPIQGHEIKFIVFDDYADTKTTE
jgi:hypothetical protein